MRPLAGRSPFFYGWVIVAFAIVGNMVSAGSLFWAVTLYVPEIAEEFDVGRTPVVAAFMVGQTVFAALGMFTGRYIDGHGSRGVLLAGSALAPLMLVGTAQATAVWQLYLGWILVSMARTALMPIPYNWVLTRWFEGRSRQAALGVVTVGFGLGGAVMLPLLAFVQSMSDWRGAMMFSGLVVLVVHGGIALFVIADRPRDLGMRPLGAVESADGEAAPEERGFTAGQAVRGLPFWCLAFGLMLFFLGQGAVTTLSIDFFDSRAVTVGATLVAASALLRAVARFPLGLGMSRVTRVHTLAIAVNVTQAVAVAVLVLSTSWPGLLTWVLLWGIGGAFAPMLEPLLITRAYGVKHFGAISGVEQMVAFGGQIFGPIGGAALYDATGSYDLPFLLYALCFALSAGLLALMALAMRSDAHRLASERAGLIEPRRPERDVVREAAG